MYQPPGAIKDLLKRISFPELIVRNLIALAFGVMIAAFVAVGVGISFPELKLRVFFLLALFWIVVSISIFVRTIRDHKEPSETFASVHDWKKETLPAEFRFITLDTTLQEITDKIGPYTRITGSGAFRAVQYDLPYGAAVLIFPESPSNPNSRIRGIRFYSNRDEILERGKRSGTH